MDSKTKEILDHLMEGDAVVVKRIGARQVWVWRVPSHEDNILCNVVDDLCIRQIASVFFDLEWGEISLVQKGDKDFYKICKYAALGQTFSGGIGMDSI